MRLELGTFPVRDVIFGNSTDWDDGVLKIDHDGLVGRILKDPRIKQARLELARPGESTRITKMRDTIEPRVKVAGPGIVYPGLCGRSVTPVGSGRTHRLEGVGVMEISAMPMYDGYDSPVEGFIDMSGPAVALTPLASIINVCLSLEPDHALSLWDQNDATHTAALLVSDTLANTVAELTPPQTDVYELPPVDVNLPGVVYIQCIRSSEHYSQSIYAYWTAFYGQTRLTPPWLFHPNEILDGAINGGSPYHGPAATSWCYVNNPVIQELYAEHGKTLNFKGVIGIRTRWSSQEEKDLTSRHTAKLSRQIGADGALITWDSGGNDFMETIRTVQACEQAGIKTVLLTGEEHPDSGGPSLLEPLVEADAIVSIGFGGLDVGGEILPAVKRIIGYDTVASSMALPTEQIPAGGELTGFRGRDIYGFGRKSAFSY